MRLLSPAGSPESLLAALKSGADGVYFGGAAFNARRGAANFFRRRNGKGPGPVPPLRG